MLTAIILGRPYNTVGGFKERKKKMLHTDHLFTVDYFKCIPREVKKLIKYSKINLRFTNYLRKNTIFMKIKTR